MTLPGEFDLIARHFRPLAGPGALDLSDDAAVLSPPPGRELVLTADALVAGVHFLPDDPPDLVARKLLRVNLSDLAAMGATPWGFLLTLAAARETPDSWFGSFAHGLGEDARRFGIALLGGDTTATPGPVTLSLTALGLVLPGAALRRKGAVLGDDLWVTGTIGDGALGLLALRGEVQDPDGTLARRYHLPEPRLGLRLHGIAHAAMDVSDGLVQDAGHLARAAGLCVEIHAASVPTSPAARAAGRLELRLTGGDDYELLLAVPPSHANALLEAAGSLPITRVGRFVGGQGVRVLNEAGSEISLERQGWSHF